VRFLRRRGELELQGDREEAAALASVVGQLLRLLTDDDATPSDDPLAALVGLSVTDARRPDDPALARLFPDAYDTSTPEGESAAGDFRRFTEADLRAGKRANADAVLESLAALAEDGRRVALDDAAAEAWLGCLNDVRLVLGTRLEVTEDTYDEMASLRRDDPRSALLLLYAQLGYLQEALLECLDGG
jgi:hypothetical protein